MLIDGEPRLPEIKVKMFGGGKGWRRRVWRMGCGGVSLEDLAGVDVGSKNCLQVCQPREWLVFSWLPLNEGCLNVVCHSILSK